VIWLALGLVATGALAPLVRRRRDHALVGALARARAAHARLGLAVETADAAPQRLERARERWTTCGGLLATARSARQCAAAERVAEEGLLELGS
jgi:hypothetical protein